MAMIKLIDIASARSGDKNNVCNIGVMAKSVNDYDTCKSTFQGIDKRQSGTI